MLVLRVVRLCLYIAVNACNLTAAQLWSSFSLSWRLWVVVVGRSERECKLPAFHMGVAPAGTGLGGGELNPPDKSNTEPTSWQIPATHTDSVNVYFRDRVSTVSASRCYKHSAATNWNDLPYDITDCSSVSAFKCKLKSHLFSIGIAYIA